MRAPIRWPSSGGEEQGTGDRMTSVVSRDICPAHHRGSAHGSSTDGSVDGDQLLRPPSSISTRSGRSWSSFTTRRPPRSPCTAVGPRSATRSPPPAPTPTRPRSWVRRPRRLAQLRALHRAAVLEEPAGARPARRAGARGRRRGVRHAPARVHPRRPDPVDDLGLRPRPPGPSGSAHPQRPARPLRRLPHAVRRCAATVATSPSPTARWPLAGRRPSPAAGSTSYP